MAAGNPGHAGGSSGNQLARLGMRPRWPVPRGFHHMLKTTSLVMVAGIAVVSTAIPRTAALAAFSLNEPGAMLLLATALFGLASIVRRHGKGERRS